MIREHGWGKNRGAGSVAGDSAGKKHQHVRDKKKFLQKFNAKRKRRFLVILKNEKRKGSFSTCVFRQN